MDTQETLKNPATMKNEELHDEASYLKKSGYIEFNDDTSRNDLIKLVVEGRAKKLEKDTGNSGDGGSNDTPLKKGEYIYYWLKGKCYVNNTVTWDAGFYRVNGLIARLKESPHVEVFEQEVSDVKIFEIANHFMVKTGDSQGQLRPTDEVLEELVITRDMPEELEQN